jgi:hypothetical protein
LQRIISEHLGKALFLMKPLIVNKVIGSDKTIDIPLKIILTGFYKYWLGIPCDE